MAASLGVILISSGLSLQNGVSDPTQRERHPLVSDVRGRSQNPPVLWLVAGHEEADPARFVAQREFMDEGPAGEAIDGRASQFDVGWVQADTSGPTQSEDEE
jgi:hypothetical protein